MMAEQKSVTQKFIEGFGLEFPQDAEKFIEIFERFADGGTLGQFTADLCEAFPEKRESILSVPVYVDKDDEN